MIRSFCVGVSIFRVGVISMLLSFEFKLRFFWITSVSVVRKFFFGGLGVCVKRFLVSWFWET